MHVSVSSTFAAFAFFISWAAAQTVIASTDTAKIQYSSDWVAPNICRFTSDGKKFESGQDGCYNLGPTPCVDRFMMANKPNSSATFSFHGTGVAVETLTQNAQSQVKFTLDGVDTTITISPVAHYLECAGPVFERNDLDDGKEHTLIVTLLDQPPESQDAQGSYYWLALNNFIIAAAPSKTPDSSAKLVLPSPLNSASVATLSLLLALFFYN
ncbi:hypothetical protein BKA62DRAFT_756746 [Auriculariales sp. MPI-PUGE-AT-0066]|nr:hypothetical protein BKA62DRAFT_756746 [Auriculariales sp. MPI-PUGE-AT-0066]